MKSLKKKICVTVFLDELFEVVDEPTKKFHVQSSSPAVVSKRRESASKTSFSRKFSDPLEGKLKSWSENYFSPKEKKIKKSRGGKPKLPVSVKNELYKLESRLKEKPEKETIPKLEIKDSFDDEWSKECVEEKISEAEVSDNYSEFFESDSEVDDKSPVIEIKKIVEVTKLMESREIIQKMESVEKSEMIKIEEAFRPDEEDFLRHSLCSHEIKKSFEELFRRKDSAFAKSQMSVRNESCSEKSLAMDSKLSEMSTRPILQNDFGRNQEKILCYAVQVKMATFDKIARAESRIPSCLMKDFKDRKESLLLNEEVDIEDSDVILDEVQEALMDDERSGANEEDGDDDDESNKTPISEVPIQKTEIGIVNVLEFKQIANFAYEGLLLLPKPYEKEESVTEKKPSSESNLKTDESSTVICTVSMDDLCEDDIHITCQLDF